MKNNASLNGIWIHAMNPSWVYRAFGRH